MTLNSLTYVRETLEEWRALSSSPDDNKVIASGVNLLDLLQRTSDSWGRCGHRWYVLSPQLRDHEV